MVLDKVSARFEPGARARSFPLKLGDFAIAVGAVLVRGEAILPGLGLGLGWS